MTGINTIAVLGSGVMGGGIAALAANAGLRVVLLDIVPKDAENRNMLAEGAVKRMLAASPSAFTSPERADLVTCGNLEDDLHLLADADWIIEAVIEKREIKQDVYRKVDAVRKKGSVLSSNTSTIPLHELLEGLPAQVAEDFMIAHFFNPPRFMRLLEVLKSPQTSQSHFERICQFADVSLGKEIVQCKDTPGFIANRIGVFWMTVALNEAVRLGVPVEEADAVMGRPLGIPKTGVFGLYDLIGLDLMLLIAREMLATLPEHDAFRALDAEPEILKTLIAEGYTGRKGKGGFSRMQKAGEKKVKETLDLSSGQYRPEQKAQLPSARAKNIKELFDGSDVAAQYARSVMVRMLHYAASLVPEIAEDIASVDAAMRNGYNWKFGPFELIDQLGGEAFIEHLHSLSLPVPKLLESAHGKALYRFNGAAQEQLGLDGHYHALKRPAGILLLADLKRTRTPVMQNASAALWDMGDGVACLEFTTKMNAIDHDLLSLIEAMIPTVAKDFAGLVIGNDGDVFSAGANLQFFLSNAEHGEWSAIDALIRHGQEAFMQLKYAPFPSVAALSGLALGGGCETALHCTNVQAYMESYPGLVEVNVGLIPAWGGCKEMLLRHAEPLAPFSLILSAKTASSADDAGKIRILGEHSRISMNRHRLLADAKALCLEMKPAYRAPSPALIALPAEAKAQLEQALAQQSVPMPAHTHAIGKVLVHVLSAGGRKQVREQDMLDLEREGFMELIKTKASQERIQHMLNTGKPLKN